MHLYPLASDILEGQDWDVKKNVTPGVVLVNDVLVTTTFAVRRSCIDFFNVDPFIYKLVDFTFQSLHLAA